MLLISKKNKRNLLYAFLLLSSFKSMNLVANNKLNNSAIFVSGVIVGVIGDNFAKDESIRKNAISLKKSIEDFAAKNLYLSPKSKKKLINLYLSARINLEKLRHKLIDLKNNIQDKVTSEN